MRMNPPREPNTPSGSREEKRRATGLLGVDNIQPVVAERLPLPRPQRPRTAQEGGRQSQTLLAPDAIDHPRAAVSACLARPAKGSRSGIARFEPQSGGSLAVLPHARQD